MTVSRNEIQGEWSGADSKSVSAGGSETSDAVALSATAVHRDIQIKADSAGTPASGDTVDCYWLPTLGDPDADPDSADEYDTTGHAVFLAQLDTNTDDPAILTVELPALSAEAGKLYVESNAAANSITVSFQVKEVLSS